MSYQDTSLSLAPAFVGTTLLAAIRRLGFWAAVVLPVAYLPVLHGVVGQSRFEIVAALFVLNVVCLWLGQGHRP